ncbi:MAG: hypothetical protein M3N08_01580 [Pseudomonadota bacterium]|nr:hypothetical protein [Pseudomonadota bacterium]
MDPHVSEQLDKVLALADSSFDAEAVVAVRKARQMLSRDGLSFSDLARAASARPRPKGFGIFSSPQQAQLETQILQLRQRLDDLHLDVQAQNIQLEFWSRRAGELEQNFRQARLEAERWRQLARDTVEKLWNLGREVGIDELSSGPAASVAARDSKTA